MKTKHIFLSVLIASSGFAFTACDGYLDEVPEASISPEVYFTEATHIQASADNLYADILPSHGTGNTYGIYKDDATTDNQIEVTAPNRFTCTLWKVKPVIGTSIKYTRSILYYRMCCLNLGIIMLMETT